MSVWNTAAEQATASSGNSITTEFGYDKAGNRTSVEHPNFGAVTFAYTGLGELRRKTEGTYVTTYGYDVLGRIEKRDDPDGVAQWTYDPAIERFLSPDPVVADASFSQGWNAYSYALNSPLSYSDPSGLTLVGGCPPSICGGGGRGGFAPGSVLASSSHVVRSVQYTLSVSFGGWMNFGFPTVDTGNPLILNISNAGGARRASSPESAPHRRRADYGSRIRLTLWVTAQTHSVGVNAPVDVGGDEQSPVDEPISVRHQSAAQTGNFTVGNATLTAQDAKAVEALNVANPLSIRDNLEYGGFIYRNPDGTYDYTTPIKGADQAFNPSSALHLVPLGSQIVGDYHTHGDYSVKHPATGAAIRTSNPALDSFNSDNFSPTDRSGIAADAAGNASYRGYLGTPSGTFRAFDPVGNREYIIRP